MFDMRPKDLDLKTPVEVGGAQHIVSTVALCIEHGGGTWYETMVFPSAGGKISSWTEEFCERYEACAQAEAGHALVVAGVTDGTIALGYGGE